MSKILIEIPDNATNGDMIRAMFSDSIINVLCEAAPVPYVSVMGENYEYNIMYPLKWWNAPYRTGSEDKK